ncbi:(2Fe-2S)-binding protein [Pseudonocardia acaciae]|uniref:(2Fe-2S)-binding protein n=1 Tax=Pseudonocardia acaciae TaxID=551276 RepID=UPI000688C73E|nr:(2Fe-2S)-binding protein [Pseudonocardia acaciae]
MSETAPPPWRAADEPAPCTVVVNGTPTTMNVHPRRTLADALREHGLTGTHLGCEHGVCGSCTVLLDDDPVRSCLTLAVQAEHRRVDTVEGLAGEDGPNALQRAFHRGGALQCGFCTPGFLMLATALLRSDPDAGPEQVRDRLTANVCRCTGGVPIMAAVLDAQQAAS